MNSNLLLGYFGFENDQIDGQTIKTRLVGEVLAVISKETYDFYDTQIMKKNPFRAFQNIIIKTLKSKNIFIMPGQNGLKIIFPLLFIIKLFSSKKIYYIVVGGWLPLFIKKHHILKFMLLRIDGIYIESNLMKNQLESQGFDNIDVFHNFRKIKDNITVLNDSKFKIVYFSRVMEAKGIYDLLEAFKLLKRNDIYLDIYGPIDPSMGDTFLQRVEDTDNVEYKGILKSNLNKTLAQYKFMVFPTYYEGEGFPGAVIDAYISSLPIIASNWKFNFEFVKDDYTGLLFEPRNIKELKEKMQFLIENEKYLNKLKDNALKESKIYSFENARCFLEQIIQNKKEKNEI